LIVNSSSIYCNRIFSVVICISQVRTFVFNSRRFWFFSESGVGEFEDSGAGHEIYVSRSRKMGKIGLGVWHTKRFAKRQTCRQ